MYIYIQNRTLHTYMIIDVYIILNNSHYYYLSWASTGLFRIFSCALIYKYVHAMNNQYHVYLTVSEAREVE